MNTLHPLYRFASMAVIAIMLWNVAGWLGMGMMMHHAHTDSAKNHCEIILCSCEIQEGQKICTCHHHEMSDNESHHNSGNQTEDCYYTAPHSSGSSSSLSLIVTAKYNALNLPIEEPVVFQDKEFLPPNSGETIVSGFKPDLLRPPRS